MDFFAVHTVAPGGDHDQYVPDWEEEEAKKPSRDLAAVRTKVRST